MSIFEMSVQFRLKKNVFLNKKSCKKNDKILCLIENKTMTPPIRCFTCGKVIGNKWENYIALLQAEYTEGDALDALNLMMILLTNLKINDGLVLAASIQKMKRLLKVGAIESDTYMFHHKKIVKRICCVILTEREISKEMAFAFVTDIMGEFHNEYGSKFESVSKPYAFIEFDKDIQNAQNKYTVNFDDVIQRGESLSALEDKLTNSSLSKIISWRHGFLSSPLTTLCWQKLIGRNRKKIG